MTIAEITKKMIDYSEGDLHDISHFLKVHAFARLIGECENLDSGTQEILEVAALVHDIACPLCRRKYGNTNGKYQETEGKNLAASFLKDTGLPQKVIERVSYLVGHHHTFTNIDGKDYQILVEADYLVNADESSYTKDNIRNTRDTIFRTKTGKELLESVYKKKLSSS